MGKTKKPRWAWLRSHRITAAGAVLLITLLLLGNQLTTLFPEPNPFEAQAMEAYSQTPSPDHIVNAPYYIVAQVFDTFTSPLMALRLTSALAGLTLAIALGYTLRRWFSDRIAIAGSLFIVTSSWFLAFSRIGAPFVMGALWLAVLIALGAWRTYTTKPLLTDFFIVVIAGLSLYTPFYVWLAIIGVLVLALRRKRQFFVIPRRHQWLLLLVFAVFAAPIVYAAVREFNAVSVLLGMDSLPASGGEFIRRTLQNVSQLFIRGTEMPSLNLGRLPLLDIFTVVMCGLGFYYFEKQLKLRRSQILVSTGTVSAVLVSLTAFSIGELAILFPVVMLLAVGGIVEMLERWLKGFPHNPVARTVGVCVVVTAVGFTSFYHLQRYFVAWANNPDVIRAHQTEHR